MIYAPSDDSFLLEIQVKKYSLNKSILDIGSGSGIQARAALSSGAKSVLCLDINPKAVSELKKTGLSAVQSNLFSVLSQKDKFDLIIFNPPYLPQDKREDKESSIITSGGNKGDEIIIRFIKQSSKHLNKSGFILLVLSSLTPKDIILKTLDAFSLKKEILSSKKFFMETLEVWKLSR